MTASDPFRTLDNPRGLISFNAKILRIVVATLLCLVLQVSWGDNDDGDLIVQEYYRLLNAANEGDAGDKVSLFLYTAKHAGELEKYTETVLKLLAEASNSGYGEASFWIGYISENGIWMDKSDQGAMIYYVLSAQQGYDKGMHACVTYFGQAAVAAASDVDRESALSNAQEWYDTLSEIREESPVVFGSARFNHAITRLKLSSMDEYGMTLLSEAAIDGHEAAAALVRKFHAMALSTDLGGDENASRVFEVLNSTIQVIGPGETKAQ